MKTVAMMTDEEIFQMAPCLAEGPLRDGGLELVKTALRIPKSRMGDILKTWAIYYMFITKEKAFEKNTNPTEDIIQGLSQQKALLSSFLSLDLSCFPNQELTNKDRSSLAAIEQETGNHYGHLFKNFDSVSYFEEAANLLETRLRVNGIFPENLSSKSILDAGCGGGRYSAAWKKLGSKKVVGVDFSEVGVQNARERLKSSDLEVTYQVEDVLDLSFADDTFDIAFSNGVLHHSRNIEKGLRELIRVLKPGGMGWLYLIESPGGYFWDIIEILRVIMSNVSNEIAREALTLIGVLPNRIFYILDHIMAPINIRLTDDEIQNLLRKNGAKNIRRLERGCSFDRIEKIYHKTPFAELKYGAGEHRYVFSK